MVILDLKNNYSRYNQILYCNDEPMLRFTESNFINWGPQGAMKTYLSVDAVKYMQKYINATNKFEIMKGDTRIKKFFFDVETTGVDYKRNSIHQFTCWIEIAGEVVEKLNLFIRPHPKALIEQEAMDICRVTKEQIMEYPPMEEQFQKIKDMLLKYVDPFEKGNKFFLIGFKNASFDDDFLKKYFDLMGSKFFLYFYASSIDVSCLAAQYLLKQRSSMPTFKLHRVAKTLGIEVDDSRLHDADYDVHLTREVYLVVTRLTEESLF